MDGCDRGRGGSFSSVRFAPGWSRVGWAGKVVGIADDDTITVLRDGYDQGGGLIFMTFDSFKEKIISNTLNSEQIFQRFFIDAETYFFNHVEKENDFEYIIKKDIAQVVSVHINDVYIVGSAKVGFSMKPKEYGRVFDGNFLKSNLKKDRSDLDVAIISSRLFDEIQETIYDWTNGFRKSWDQNSFYGSGREIFGVELKYKFLEYLGKGWFRPDLSPAGFKIETANGQLDMVINTWRKKIDRKISFAVYKNWVFFKKYQLENIEKLMIKINAGELL